MQNDNWHDFAHNRKPLVKTGRDLIALTKYPTDLDFIKTIAGTQYVVYSHFNKDADECMVGKVSRLALRNKK